MFQPLNAQQPNTDIFGAEGKETTISNNEVEQEEEEQEEDVVTIYSNALHLMAEKQFSEAEQEFIRIKKVFTAKIAGKRCNKLLFPLLTNLADCYQSLLKTDEAVKCLENVSHFRKV